MDQARPIVGREQMKTVTLTWQQISNPVMIGEYFSGESIEVSSWKPEEILDFVSWQKEGGRCYRFSIFVDITGPFEVYQYCQNHKPVSEPAQIETN